MSTIPEITVLMPAFNTGKYIAEAVTSILKQTFEKFELLIINDGSTDNTLEVIKKFNDPRIIIIDLPHRGIADALNTGLGLARSRYVARFDSDDICDPQRLDLQYKFMLNNPGHVLIGTEAEYVDNNGEHVYHFNAQAHSHEEIVNLISKQCPFIHSSVMFDTAIARKLGGYDPRAHTFEDHLLWIKFIKTGRAANLRKPLIKVRLNPGSITIDEKLRGKRFNDLRKQILLGDKPITPDEETELLKILGGQNMNGFKNYSYHILLAKKYLWNNYQPIKARTRLWKAITFRPLKPMSYGLLILSWLPKKVISNFYKNYKQYEHHG